MKPELSNPKQLRTVLLSVAATLLVVTRQVSAEMLCDHHETRRYVGGYKKET